MINEELFTTALEKWFKTNGRHDLPWRQDFNPYKVWVSEIMLQQTQVNRVQDKFFSPFVERFPNIETLAKSSWEEVYPYWKGLGFYSRGKNMIRTAKEVCRRFSGIFPTNLHDLESLPGIGAYTASAILSFSHDEKIPAIDTNIKKIISVLFPGKNILSIAQKCVLLAESGREWNGAMMDLATILRKKNAPIGEPLTEFFPEEIREKFYAKRKKAPQKTEQKSRKKRIEVGVACIHKNGKYLIQTRPDDKSFSGQWEFPGGKRERGEDFRTCVKREIQEEIGVDISVRPHFFVETHEFEHVRLHLRFHRCQIQSGTPKALENQQLQWVSPEDFDSINFLKTNAKALQKLKKIRR